MKFTTATGAVIAWVRVRISAKKKSFHAYRKHRMAVAARPGADSGSTTRRNPCPRPAPSIQAACSSVGTNVRLGGNAKISPGGLSDICSSHKNGASTSSTSTPAAALSSQGCHVRLVTAGLPADRANDGGAEHQRGRDQHDGDCARVAEIREVERLQIGIVVRHLGHRPRPAIGEDEDQREGLDAVDEPEEAGHQEDAAQER